MYLIREVMYCKPGKVRGMVDKFKGLAGVMKELGYKPFRVFTDVSADRFWTVVAESEVASLNDFLEMEKKVMSEAKAQEVMSGYHDFVDSGRREIYKVEA